MEGDRKQLEGGTSLRSGSGIIGQWDPGVQNEIESAVPLALGFLAIGRAMLLESRKYVLIVIFVPSGNPPPTFLNEAFALRLRPCRLSPWKIRGY